MTGAAAAVGLAAAAALLDLAAPASATPSGVRRLVRALPAGALAVALRLAGAPPLPGLALLAFAVADALALDGREAGVGGWTVTLLAQLVLAAALWELASPRLLAHAPWRGAGALAVVAGGLALIRTGRRPRGELAPLALVSVGLLAAAAAAAGAQPLTAWALPFGAAVALWAAVTARAWWSGPGEEPSRADSALRSGAALAFALPLLPWPR